MALDAQAGLTLFNAIATAGRTIYELAQGLSNLDTKAPMMERAQKPRSYKTGPRNARFGRSQMPKGNCLRQPA